MQDNPMHTACGVASRTANRPTVTTGSGPGLIRRLASRKLWVAVASGAMLALSEELGVPLSEDNAMALAAVAAAYLLGQGVEDAGRASRRSDRP
jgi:hypothetical protein